MGRKRNSEVNVLFRWVRSQSIKVKSFLALILFMGLVLVLKLMVKDRGHLFVASEAIHFAGIVVLIYKLIVHKTCSGLSLKMQELTALFLAVRLSFSIIMEADIHTVLDLSTFVSTLWVIYMMRFKLKSTYIKELDNFPMYYTVVPSAILALLIHPYASYLSIWGISFAFALYLESVSVLPQLRHMQNAKIVEPFTAHYVFALGVARFLGCAHWIIQLYETSGAYLFLIGSGYLWFPAVILAEMVQTFILADFCYYYIKSFMDGQLLVTMPV